MRISNLDCLSNCIDRLITERIKLWHFQQQQQASDAAHQARIIAALRAKLSDLFSEAVAGRYQCVQERRTFSSHEASDFCSQVENLLLEDLTVGQADKAKLLLAKEVFRCRKANETRSQIKNAIEDFVGRALPPVSARQTTRLTSRRKRGAAENQSHSDMT